MSTYLEQAWLDELVCEPYADLPDAERRVRDAALGELLQDAVGAVREVDLRDGLDELYALLSWIDDPSIWPAIPAPGKTPRKRTRR